MNHTAFYVCTNGHTIEYWRVGDHGYDSAGYDGAEEQKGEWVCSRCREPRSKWVKKKGD